MIGAPDLEALMARRARMFIHAAIDLYLGDLARQGRAPSTCAKYKAVLDPFGDQVRDKTLDEITSDDVRRYLDRWSAASKSTLALYVTVIRRFFDFCVDEGIVRTSPAERLKRPPRPRPEDLDVVTITDSDVGRLFAACADWQERLCIAVLAYMGVRKTAAANVRRRDVDLETGLIRFREKGGKTITKPVPDELLALLRKADELGQWLHGDEWLIPNRKPWLVKSTKRRGSKIIYETVVRVADRAGVRAHPHSIRAAFAVRFDAAHPDQVTALRELLGHARVETTMTYLRRKDKAAAMEAVRDLSWFPSRAAVPPAGFEPALQESAAAEQTGTEREGPTLPDALLERAHGEAEAAKSSDRVSRAERREDAQARKGAGS